VATNENQQPPAEEDSLGLEIIVNRVGRPMLPVVNDDYVVEGPEAAIWEARLGNAAVRAALRQVIPSVGRIEVDNHPYQNWVGTGWLITKDLAITAAFVADEFTAPRDGGRVFKPGWPNRQNLMVARIDFRREGGEGSLRPFAVQEVLPFGEEPGGGVAFLRLERLGPNGPLPNPLRLSTRAPQVGQYVAVIGHMTVDPQAPELTRRLYGDAIDAKRVAPGQVTKVEGDHLGHDCSATGGGPAGAPIVDLATGEVVGMHLGGQFLVEYTGLTAAALAKRLSRTSPTGSQTSAEYPIADLAPSLEPHKLRRWLRDVLLHQFSYGNDLAILLEDALGKTLGQVATGPNLTEVCFNLIRWLWVDPDGRLRPLLEQAIRDRQNCADLRKILASAFATG
jgi:endonuclease G